MIVNKGILYWITGLSGSGKTTISKDFYQKIKNKNPNTIFLDGDLLREVLDLKHAGYDNESRYNIAMQYARLAKLFTDQGINVIFATISMFEQVRAWNRSNIEKYVEIYIKMTLKEIFARDKNQLFSKALNKEEKNVVGVDISFEEPKNPDIVLHNNSEVSINKLSKDLIKKVKLLKLNIL